MRLIDADALRQTMESNLYWGLDSDGAILDTIDEAPTIEAAPVVHGRWKQRGKNLGECSECGEVVLVRYRYCPNCGARMDGDGKAPTTPTTNHRVCKHCKTAVIGMEEYAECPVCGHQFEEDAN